MIFELLGQIVDVGMENFDSPPPPETVVQAGTIVRDALAAANGGS